MSNREELRELRQRVTEWLDSHTRDPLSSIQCIALLTIAEELIRRNERLEYLDRARENERLDKMREI